MGGSNSIAVNAGAASTAASDATSATPPVAMTTTSGRALSNGRKGVAFLQEAQGAAGSGLSLAAAGTQGEQVPLTASALQLLSHRDLPLPSSNSSGNGGVNSALRSPISPNPATPLAHPSTAPLPPSSQPNPVARSLSPVSQVSTPDITVVAAATRFAPAANDMDWELLTDAEQCFARMRGISLRDHSVKVIGEPGRKQ